MSNQFQLLKERRYRPYFFTQFLGAFNDNVFKTAFITLVAFNAAKLTSISSTMLVTVLPGVFILPFFLFSATAGQIADKLEKSYLIRLLKIIEIVVMILASIGFLLGNLTLLIITLFLMGTHSALFGPVKFGYLPQHLDEQELIGGNGMIEMATFVAILAGQILGAWVMMLPSYAVLASVAITSIAVLGFVTSRGIPFTPAADTSIKVDWNPITQTFRNLCQLWGKQTLWLAAIAISWFWFYGATVLAQFPNLAKIVLGGDESVFICLLVVFSIGVGIGSLMCESLSKGKNSLGLVLIGAFGLTLFGFDLYFNTDAAMETTSAQVQNYMGFLSQWENWRILTDIAMIGLSGGFYIVPLYVLIQTECQNSHLSRVIAANNILNALFMVISAGISAMLLGAGYSIPQLFLVTAGLTIIVMAYLCFRQPRYLSSFIAWFK